MTVGMKIADERREAKAEGRAEGIIEGRKEGHRDGLKEGHRDGLKEGRELNKWLIDNNRSEELIHSVNDEELYNCLLEEYKLAMKQ